MDSYERFDFIPLKNLIRTDDKFFNKLPVTYLNREPQRGADSNLKGCKPTIILYIIFFYKITYINTITNMNIIIT